MAPMRGRDLSHYQNTNLATLVKEDHLSFVALKATQGSGFVDSRHAAYAKQARAIDGLVVGHYHYLDASKTAASQLDIFLHTANPQAGEFLVLDMERGPGAAVAHDMAAFGDGLAKQCPGLTRVVYMGSGYAGSKGGKNAAKHYDYWWYPRYWGSLTVWPTVYNPKVSGPNITGWPLPHLHQWSASSRGMDADVSYLSKASLISVAKPQPKPKPPGSVAGHVSLQTVTPIPAAAGKVYTVGFETEVSDPKGWHGGSGPTFVRGPVNGVAWARLQLTTGAAGAARFVEYDETKAALHKAYDWIPLSYNADRIATIDRPAMHVDTDMRLRLQFQLDAPDILLAAAVQFNF